MEYTQEMYDSGVKPAIGDTVRLSGVIGDRLIDFEGRAVVIIGESVTDMGKIILTFSHATIGVGCGFWFKGGVFHPIKTHKQLEEEKLFNYLRSVVDSMVDKREEDHKGYDRDYMLSEVRGLYNAGFIVEPK